MNICGCILQTINAEAAPYLHIFISSSLLSMVSDDDISVGFRPLRALLVGERIIQFEI